MRVLSLDFTPPFAIHSRSKILGISSVADAKCNANSNEILTQQFFTSLIAPEESPDRESGF